MAENSTKKPRFLPDPSKWIQTAPTSSTKKAQRPLTALRNGFGTPPTTNQRPTSNSGVKKQGSIVQNGFFTPTNTSIKKGSDDSATRRGSPSTKTGKEEYGKLKKSRLRVRADERRSSPADDEVDARELSRNRPRPSPFRENKATAPLQNHRSAPVSSSSGMSDSLDQQTPPRKRRRTTTLSPLFPPGSPIASHTSSDRPITPIPDYVLDIHRRLCGREFTRLKSPGAKGSPKKNRKEREKEKGQKAIDERAHDRALERRRNREKENEHRLVGSSQSHADEVSPKKEGKRKHTHNSIDVPRLAPMVVNTLHHTPSKHDTPRPTRKDVHRPAQNTITFSPSAIYNELCNPSPPPNTPPKSRQLRRIPTGSSSRSAIPITSPSPSPAPDMAPPTEPGYKRDFQAVSMQAETLFSWGGNTRTPTRPEPRPIQHHQAEEFDSTETQSLAPSAASQSFPNIIPSPTRPVPAMFAHFDRPRAKPQKKTSMIMPETIRRTSNLNQMNNTAILSSRSVAAFHTNLAVAETILPPNPPDAEHAKATPKPSTVRRPRSSGSGWPAFGFDETTPTQAARLRDEESPTSASKKRKATTATTGTQSKLAAFGFFGEKPKKPVRGFEEDWDREANLTFDYDMEDDAMPEEGKNRIDGLQAVPAPPPHPSLRPAGLRELKRLEAARSTRPPFVNHDKDNEHENDNQPEDLFPEIQPSSSSSHIPTRHGGSSSSASSVTTESELGMNSSAVAWWDGLEDRRSSEFESMPRLP